jgi:hypothetical protein
MTTPNGSGITNRGTDYVDGSQVTSSNLNNHVDDAVFNSNAVDDSTIGLNSSTPPALFVKDEGITLAKIEPASISGPSGLLLDEDDFSSNSDTRGATQQSIKAYTASLLTPVTDVTFENNWSNLGTQSAIVVQDVQYYQTADGLVHLQGMCTGGSPINTTIFTLPEGLRPAKAAFFVVVSFGATSNGPPKIRVGADGQVYAFSIGNNAGVSLNGIYFKPGA